MKEMFPSASLSVVKICTNNIVADHCHASGLLASENSVYGVYSPSYACMEQAYSTRPGNQAPWHFMLSYLQGSLPHRLILITNVLALGVEISSCRTASIAPDFFVLCLSLHGSGLPWCGGFSSQPPHLRRGGCARKSGLLQLTRVKRSYVDANHDSSLLLIKRALSTCK